MRDHRWLAALMVDGRQIYVRKSAIIGVGPAISLNVKHWSESKRDWVEDTRAKTYLSTEDGSESCVLGDHHEFFETHLKESFSMLQPEGPGEELLG